MTSDQLGTLLDDVSQPELWFLDELVACAGKVLARGGNGRLVFVGRSLDSMFDLLSGALRDRVVRPPVAFDRRSSLTPGQVARAREVCAVAGVTPESLARRPVSFVDVVSTGSTFGELFKLLDMWIDETREPWDVVRGQLRFVGVTMRGKTSPNTWRWHQHADWTARLPGRAVVNVSLPLAEWRYFADFQTKLTRSFRPADWLAENDGPGGTNAPGKRLRKPSRWSRTGGAGKVAAPSHAPPRVSRRGRRAGCGR